MKRLAACIDRGLAVAREALQQGRPYRQDLRAVESTLRPSDEATEEERQTQFVTLWQAWEASTDPVQQQFATVMSRFTPGVFVGGEAADFPDDHLDLELLLALDAHVHHEGPFTVDDLAPYRHSRVPASQQEALRRGKMMRKARSRKNRHDLLTDLEKRYLNSS